MIIDLSLLLKSVVDWWSSNVIIDNNLICKSPHSYILFYLPEFAEHRKIQSSFPQNWILHDCRFPKMYIGHYYVYTNDIIDSILMNSEYQNWIITCLFVMIEKPWPCCCCCCWACCWASKSILWRQINFCGNANRRRSSPGNR